MRSEKFVYFSYAVLMSRGQMKQLCPRARPIGRAVLHGYKLCFPRVSGVWMGGIPSLRKSKNEDVWGVLWEGDNLCLEQMDKYQGFRGPDGENVFERRPVEVDDGEGHVLQAQAYFAPDAEVNRNSYLPSAELVDTLVRAAQDFKLPPEYVTKLERLAPN
ncbi:MAG TPA: gamma-glutamylcyclotransferase family protein [Armatimonadota bacterium]|jgi:gamma-glutamylcyclotransferase (GGCT)/AIG2-like uncharacterized protein YtfP